MKLRNLKKEVLFLAHDLAGIVSVKLFFEDVDPEKIKEAASKVVEFKNEALAQVSNPGVKAPKPLKSQLRKALRLGSGKDEAVKEYLEAKKAYAKEIAASYRKISKDMLEKYADLAESFSQVK